MCSRKKAIEPTTSTTGIAQASLRRKYIRPPFIRKKEKGKRKKCWFVETLKVLKRSEAARFVEMTGGVLRGASGTVQRPNVIPGVTRNTKHAPQFAS
jgi:hypothetical protein